MNSIVNLWINKKISGKFLFTVLLIFCSSSLASVNQDLQRLQQAYPNFITSVSGQYITWTDGTQTPVGKLHSSKQEKLDSPSLADQIIGVYYFPGKPKDPATYRPTNDAGRIRYQPFFDKMYGNNKAAVAANLTVIYWMPKIFGKEFPLQVTTVNQVNKKFEQVSAELETLVIAHPKFKEFLIPNGTFAWRVVAHTTRLSNHSYGTAIDINSQLSNYWQWDLEKNHQVISEETSLGYHNNIPWAIVLVFEKHGFIWGGKWQHYDTMHFEYRPELLIKPAK